MPDPDVDFISAATDIPVSIDFAIDIISTERETISSRLSNHFVDLTLTFEPPVTLPAFYRIVPKRLKSVIRINRDGNVDVTDGPETSDMEIVQVLSAQNAVTRYIHRPGITIDESRMTSEGITLRLKTTEPLADGPDISSADGIEALNRLHIEVITLSKDLLDYDEWVDSRLVNQGANIGSAPREAANITNASGVFGGFSRTIVTPRVGR